MNLNSFVTYLFTEHKVQTNGKGVCNIDPRIILQGSDYHEEDYTFTLRLLMMNENLSLFVMFWDIYSHFFDQRDLMTLARFLMFQLSQHSKCKSMIEPFLMSETTKMLYRNCTRLVRDEFVELFSNQSMVETMPPGVRLILGEHYIHPEEVSENVLVQMYNLIKTNDADGL
jgi:hypothetical protein